MHTFLLETKLRVPPLPQHAMRRDRLMDALEQGVPSSKLILLSAPAGYGKTTLLAQWAQASRFSVVWLSVGEEDNDLPRFLRYLLAAWEAVQPGIRESPVGLLLSAMAPNNDDVLSAFLSAAHDLTEHTVFVLDDYHLVDDPSIHQALTFLLDHLPPMLHIVLAGRGEPPLPLARYRARQELLELRAEDLHFHLDETGDFLNRLMRLDLPHDAIVPLHTRLEGWIAGLQLVALSHRRHPEAADTLVVSGRHRFIADYLSEEVLAQLPDETRWFLLQTSILDQLCGSLCDAVTGGAGAQDMLERLERAALFLVPLDNRREWFRYHRLFADALQAELHRRYPADAPHLHRRAARWYLAHDLPEQAFAHAVAGDDPDFVICIFERYVNFMLNCGEIRTVQRWLDSLPAAWHASHPLLGLFRAGLLAFTGAFDACLHCIDDTEDRLALTETEATRWQLALVTAVRCFIACIQNDLARAERYANQALQDLREESRSFRLGIYHALGDTYRRNGRWEEAKACYLAVPRFADAPGFRVQAVVQSAHVFGALADLELRQGRLRTAAAYWRKALAAIQERASWGRLELPVIGWVYLRMGEILYEWNELTDAWDHVSRGLEHAELGGDVRTRIAGYLLASRVKLAEGDIEAAAASLERARPLVEEAPFPDWTSRFERFQLELWLARDWLRAAVDWSDRMPRDGASEERPDPEVTRLALARVLIVKGDAPSIERALTLVDGLLRSAETEGRMNIQIEALALQALAHWRRGDQVGAMTALEHALRLAEREGYVRLFADLGLPMVRLLQEARARGMMPDYVGRLLAARGPDPRAHGPAEQGLLEPLTDREQETLGLLAAGLTNREIADKLFISPETVKKHTSSIYAKLGVSNRTEAAGRARELGLLD